MILVCGGLADIVTELVCARLEALAEPYRLLDLGRFPGGFDLDCTWTACGVRGMISGTDTSGTGWRLPLDHISGVYIRYLGLDGHVAWPELPAHLQELALSEAQNSLMALTEALPCTVANRASRAMSNNSKPFQAQLIRRCGLHIPDTLLTNDPQAALAFLEACDGQMIFKSVSGVRSTVRRFEQRDYQRLPLLRHSPAQFQQYIPGDNIRVHTVGDQVIATRIRSEAVDYRYASQQGHSAELEATTLPDQVAEACLRLSECMGLVIAGIDLIETPDSEYFCLEINPSPGFAYYEQSTGQAISAALVEVLRRGTPAPAEEVKVGQR